MTDEAIPVGSYAVVVLGGLGYAAFIAGWFLHAALLTPITASLGLSSTEAGVLVGIIPATYIVLSLVSGAVVDRIGPRRAVGLALLIAGAGGVGRGLAPGYLTFLAATVVLGAGGTGVTFGLPKLVSELFPARLLGTMSTVYVLGAQAGAAAAFALGRPVLEPALGGWRPVLLWVGVGLIGLGGVWLAVVGWHARRWPGRYPGRRAGGDLASLSADLRQVVGAPGMRLLLVVGFTYLLLVHGIRGWLPTILEARGTAAGAAAGVATVFVVAQAVGVVTVPPASDYLRTRRGAVAACGLFSAVGVLAVVLPVSAPVALAAAVVAGLGVGGVAPLVRALPTELPGVGAELTGTGVGLVFAVGQIGGVTGPFVIGALRDLTGSFVPGLLVLAGGGATMVAAGLALPRVADR